MNGMTGTTTKAEAPPAITDVARITQGRSTIARMSDATRKTAVPNVRQAQLPNRPISGPITSAAPAMARVYTAL